MRVKKIKHSKSMRRGLKTFKKKRQTIKRKQKGGKNTHSVRTEPGYIPPPPPPVDTGSSDLKLTKKAIENLSENGTVVVNFEDFKRLFIVEKGPGEHDFRQDPKVFDSNHTPLLGDSNAHRKTPGGNVTYAIILLGVIGASVFLSEGFIV